MPAPPRQKKRAKRPPRNAEKVFAPHVGWLTFPPGDDVARFLREGWFEYGELAFFTLFLRDGDIFIDGGAHAGLYTALAKQLTGGRGRVVAVEPNIDMAPYLAQNTGAIAIDHPRSMGSATHVTLEAALGARARASATLYVGGAGRAAYASITPGEDNDHAIETRVITLDAIAKKLPDDAPLLIKLDLEGAEYGALKGASNLMARDAHAPVFIVEYDEDHAARFQHASGDLTDILNDHGYGVFQFDAGAARLRPFAPGEEGVWHSNLIAAKDAEWVAARLAQAGSARKRAAIDIVARGKAAMDLVELRYSNKTLTPKLDKLAAEIARARAELDPSLKGQLRDLAGRLAAAAPPGADGLRDPHATANLLEEEVGQLVGACESLAKDIASDRRKLVEMRQSLAALSETEEQVTSLTARLEVMIAERERVRASWEQRAALVAQLEIDIENKTRELAGAHADQKSLAEHLAKLRTELENARREADRSQALAAELEAAQREAAKLTAKLGERDRERDELRRVQEDAAVLRARYDEAQVQISAIFSDEFVKARWAHVESADLVKSLKRSTWLKLGSLFGIGPLKVLERVEDSQTKVKVALETINLRARAASKDEPET